MDAPTSCFVSVTEDQLGFDPEPYYDPATGDRMERARYNPVNVYSPRPQFTRVTILPLSSAMAAFRRIWAEQVTSGLEYPAIVAHQLAGDARSETWGAAATGTEIAHARKVAGKLAGVLSDGTLRSL